MNLNQGLCPGYSAKAFAVGLWCICLLVSGSAQAELGDPKLVKSYRQLTKSDAAAVDHFGQSVSISGGRMVVGTPYDDMAGGTDAGSASVFERDASGKWIPVATLTDSDVAYYEIFGSSVSISGDRIVVGAAYENTAAGSGAGTASVFERNASGTWIQVAKLTDSDGAAGDSFGGSVSISGDRLVVGAPNDGTAADAYAGSVSVFERDASGAWVQVAKLTNSDVAYFELFGSAVSISGDRLVVGAPYEDTAAGTDAGTASVFERNASGTWVQVAKFTESSSAAYASFGNSVSISGDRMVVGAVLDDTPTGPNAGSASVFERNASGNWIQVAKLADSDGAAYDSLGSSVSISGDRMVAGAYGDNTPGSAYVGSASVFERDASGTWVQVAKLVDSKGGAYGQFGISVSISDSYIVAGAPGDDTAAGEDAGSAQIFSLTDSDLDYGDAPAPYPTLKADNGARHGHGRLWLGFGTPDRDPDGRPDAEAKGDDGAAMDDEDGVSFPEGALIVDDSNQAWIFVGGQSGLLDAWIDYNRDGDWLDEGERIANHLSVALGTNIIALPAFPASASADTTYFARFRLSSAGTSAPTGEVADGEVEDYRLTVTQAEVKLPSMKSVTEGEAVKIKILLSSVLDEDVTVQFATQDGTALAGHDYTATSGSLTIPTGQTAVKLTLYTTSNTLKEGDKTFTLLLTGATNAKINSSRSETLITIKDDD